MFFFFIHFGLRLYDFVLTILHSFGFIYFAILFSFFFLFALIFSRTSPENQLQLLLKLVCLGADAAWLATVRSDPFDSPFQGLTQSQTRKETRCALLPQIVSAQVWLAL